MVARPLVCVVVLYDGEDGVVAGRDDPVKHICIVFGDVFPATHVAEVGGVQVFVWPDLDDRAFVLILLSLPFAAVRDGAAYFPVAFGVGAPTPKATGK